MRVIQILTAGTLGALLWIAGSAAGETPLQQALRGQHLQTPPLLLVQYDRLRPTCRDDEKEMPRGSMVCRNGRVMVCNPRGAWEDAAKPC
jgi:hypothetical protein